MLQAAATAFFASPDPVAGERFPDAVESAQGPLFGLAIVGLFIGLCVVAAGSAAFWATTAGKPSAAATAGRMTVATVPLALAWLAVIYVLELAA